MDEPREEMSLEEEFREAEREANVEEVRIKRDFSPDDHLAWFMSHCRAVADAFDRSPRLGSRDGDDDLSEIDRLDWICNGD